MESQFDYSRTLLECHIAGFAYHDGLSVIDELKLGTKLELRHEPGNPFDPQAVAIYYGDVQLGYIPSGRCGEIFLYLYFGHEDLFEAYLSMVDDDAHPEKQLRVAVRIVDGREKEQS